MNGIHDLGGVTCFGPIDPERDEPVFHADWERRVFAMNIAALAFFGPVDRARRFPRRTQSRSRASCVTACPQRAMTAESHRPSASATRCERATSKSPATRGYRATSSRG